MTAKRLSRTRLFVVLALGLLAAQDMEGQGDSSLKSFFVVAHAVSDAAPFWFEYILDVQPEAGGARVRHMRLAPASGLCPNDVTIRGLEKFSAMPPSQLAGTDICTMDVGDYNRTIAKFRKNVVILDTSSFSINATCGSDVKTFQVPYLDALDVDGLRKQAPGAAGIVNLYGAVNEAVFRNEPINGVTHPRDYELQISGQSFMTDLSSGRFAAGFSSGRLGALLARYRGAIRKATPIPKLVEYPQWVFVKYEDPPFLGRADKVQLELTLDPVTGRVIDTKTVSGGPDFAAETARKWVFSYLQDLPNNVRVTIDYSARCQLVH